ncbi:MAG: hypothetical protein GY828_04045 [Candidatus Gracilibacteria bacterium]|nr:hypothetical protein [Candidatus Gracilibacteria bacterium]
MKKIIIIVLVGIVLYGYWEHSQPSQEVLDAQKEMGIIIDDTTKGGLGKTADALIQTVDDSLASVKDDISDIQEKIQGEQIPETFDIAYLTDEQFLEFDVFHKSDLLDGEIELTGKTLRNVDKIRVLYTNKESDHKTSDYTLGKFTAGDKKFLYNAFSRHGSFDFGTNYYTFFAYSGDDIAKVELTIYYPDPKKTDLEEEIILDPSVDIDTIQVDTLPAGTEYGSPVSLGGNKVTYSDIKGFEVEAQSLRDVNCESNNVTQFAVDKSGAWSWWNTCRPVEKENSVSFFVLSMNNGEYFYSKHYVSQGHYATIELESGTDKNWESFETVDEKNTWLQEKNTVLKEKNDTYAILDVSDNLFKEIIK